MAKFVQKLIDSKIFFILLFLIPAIAFLIGLTWTLLNVLFVVATELILAHVVYVGYAVLRQQEKMNLVQYLLLGAVWLGMLIFFSEWDSLTGWFLALIAIFILGLTFHGYTRKVSKQESLKEFCNGKFYVDLVGLFLGVCGVIFVRVFERDLLLGVLNLVAIIVVNYIIFFKIRLFDKIRK